MIKKGTILICNKDIKDTTIGKEYLVIKDNIIEDDDGWERYMKHHVEDGSFSVKSLKIGDTFEYNGFVCEIKEKIKKKIWFVIKNKHTKSITYRYAERIEFEVFYDDEDYECIKITNKEFIKQLEENAR